MAYDAFLSYSHSADVDLAPAVQSGLQRLARPWYRIRALRVFRDDTALTTSPHLWASIQVALDDSEWFVLMASPEAARSEWVQREVDRWLTTKSPERILPVVTAGALVWDRAAGAFDPVRTTALPPNLYGVFKDEPRHLDLRWAHDEEHLDLRHSQFRTAIAELAAAIHGVSKDEIESEDIRQHRRAMRLAVGGVVALVLFAVLATAATIFAFQNASDARAQKKRAVLNAELAQSRRVQASKALRRAESERKVATRQRGIAEAQRTIATKQTQEAVKSQGIATEQQQIAEQQRTVAEQQSQVAQQQTTVAQQRTTEANAAKQVADQKTGEVQRANGALAQANQNLARSVEKEHDSAQRASAQAQAAKAARRTAEARAVNATGLNDVFDIAEADKGLLLTQAALQLEPDDAQIRENSLRALQVAPPGLVRYLDRQDRTGSVSGFGSAAIVSPRGDLVASVAGGMLDVAPLSGGRALKVPALEVTGDIAFSGDGGRLAAVVGDSIAVVDLRTAPARVVTRVAAVGAENVGLDATGSRLGYTTTPDDAGNTPIDLVDVGTGTHQSFARHAYVYALALSPDGARIAFASWGPAEDGLASCRSGTFAIQQIDSGTGRDTGPVGVSHPASNDFCRYARRIRLQYEAVDGRLELRSVAPEANPAQVRWDAASMTALAEVATTQPWVVDVSEDGRRLLTVDPDGRARIIDATTQLIVPGTSPMVLTNRSQDFSRGTPFANVVKFADPAGRFIVTTGVDGKPRLFAPDVQSPLIASRAMSLAAILPDGQALVGAPDGFDVVAPATARVTAHLVVPQNLGVSVVASSRSGLVALAASTPEPDPVGHVLIYRTDTGGLLHDRVVEGTPTSVGFSLDGGTLAVEQHDDSFTYTVSLLDASSGRRRFQYGSTGASTTLLGYIPGLAILWESHFDGTTVSGRSYAVDLQSGREVALTDGQRTLTRRGVVFSGNAKVAAYVKLDGRVIVADASGRRLMTIPAATFPDSSPKLFLNPNGSILATATGQPNGLQLWDVDNGRALGRPFAIANASEPSDVNFIFVGDLGTFTRDGRLALTEDVNGQELYLEIDASPARWRVAACTIANRELTDAEWHQAGGKKKAPVVCHR